MTDPNTPMTAREWLYAHSENSFCITHREVQAYGDYVTASLRQQIEQLKDSKKSYCHLCHDWFEGQPDGHGLGECVSVCSCGNLTETDPQSGAETEQCASCQRAERAEAEVKSLRGALQVARDVVHNRLCMGDRAGECAAIDSALNPKG